MTTEEATNLILKKQIPKLKNLMDKEELHVDNIDVFCEKGCFDVDQTKRILQAGMNIGLAINFHGEELNYLGSAEVCMLISPFLSSFPNMCSFIILSENYVLNL